MFWTGFLSIISSLALYIQQQVYVGGPKNNENFFLEGRGALVPPAPAWCV